MREGISEAEMQREAERLALWRCGEAFCLVERRTERGHGLGIVKALGRPLCSTTQIVYGFVCLLGSAIMIR
jgi:hypothetical protein